MLSSGFLMSVAQGFMEGKVEQAKQQREIDAAEDERRAESDKDFAKAVVDTINSDDFSIDKLNLLYKVSGRANQFNPEEYAEFANLAEDTENSKIIGGIKFKGVSLKGTESMYNSAEMELAHLNQLLARPEFREQVENTLKKGDEDSKQWVDYLSRLELKASDGYEKEMRKSMGEGYNPTVHDYDITLYSNIAGLSPLIGKQLAEAKEVRNLGAAPPVPDGTVPVMFEVNLLDQGSKKVTIPLSNDDMPHLRELAAASNMTVQQFVSGFNDLRDLPTQEEFDAGIYEGLSDQEIAMQQYGMLRDVIELKKKGFYNLDLMAADGAKRQELVSYLTQKYGSKDGVLNRYNAATALGYLMPTPEFFTLPGQTYTFASSRKSRQGEATMNARLFLEKEMNLTPGEIKEKAEAAKYSKQTVLFLDRLYNLETTELQDETGAARVLKRVVGGLAIQAGQVKNVFAGIFNSEGQAGDTKGTQVAEFEGNYKKNPDGSITTKDTLMQTAARVAGELEMDLANITEADALKLTLAARMARAIDPSGRLSNQDFEVQLRRLGNAFLGGPEDVKRNLEILAEEFQREVQAHTVFEDVITSGKITPRKARTLMADQKLGMIIDADINVTGDSQQQQTSDAAGQKGDDSNLSSLPKFSVTNNTVLKERDDRVYVGVDGKSQPVFMAKDDGKLSYVIQIGEEYFQVDKSDIKQKGNQ